jgi:hypothetical protein
MNSKFGFRFLRPAVWAGAHPEASIDATPKLPVALRKSLRVSLNLVIVPNSLLQVFHINQEKLCNRSLANWLQRVVV